jgi:hypothetical protein
LTLDWHAPPTPKRQSHRSTKPRCGKSGTVSVIQAPRAQLLDQPLRKVALASLQHTDRDTSEVPYCTTGRVRSGRSSRPDHGVWWGSGHWTSSATPCRTRMRRAKEVSSLGLNILAAIRKRHAHWLVSKISHGCLHLDEAVRLQGCRLNRMMHQYIVSKGMLPWRR